MSNIKLNAKLRAYSNASIELPALAVDDALSETSTNPVQNKVISVALGNKVTMPNTDGIISAQDGQISTIESLSVEDTKSLFGSVCDSLMSRKTSMPGKGVR